MTRILRGALGIAAMLVLWDLAVRLEWVDPLLLASPERVLIQLWYGWTVPSLGQSRLLQASIATAGHFAGGFGLSILVGIAAGALLAMARVVYEFGNAAIRLLQYTPPATLLPLLILYFDRGTLTILVYVVIGSVWPILIHTRDALSNRDPTLVAAARNLGWKDHQLFWGVLLPASVSEIVSGIRIAASMALITTIVGEFLAGESGLGFDILLAQRTFEYRSMYAGIVTLAMIGLLTNYGLMFLERRFTRWRSYGRYEAAA
jgi:NitT/TauT family transport system permease protein